MKIAAIIPNYNSAATVAACVRSLLGQHIPSGCRFEIIVVDDGSDDTSLQALRSLTDCGVNILALEQNSGRCTARNTGARATDADWLLFIDSDCIAANADMVSRHLESLASGADVVFGEVLTPGHGFWDRLQRDASSRRAKEFKAGHQWAYTTQNVAISRKLFVEVGGFDPRFERHGFEDRDIFIRLIQRNARVERSPLAAVYHRDTLTLSVVSGKLRGAGRHAAHQFRQRHPHVYDSMAFSRLDCDLHPWLTLLDRLTWPFTVRSSVALERLLNWKLLPFMLRAAIARTIYGLHFLHGTVERNRQS